MDGEFDTGRLHVFRQRIRPGIVAVILPMMVAILPVAAFDAGRFHWSAVPLWAIILGYAGTLIGIAVTAWAQAVNPYFEPGVRIQSERHQRVIDTGPYRFEEAARTNRTARPRLNQD